VGAADALKWLRNTSHCPAICPDGQIAGRRRRVAVTADALDLRVEHGEKSLCPLHSRASKVGVAIKDHMDDVELELRAARQHSLQAHYFSLPAHSFLTFVAIGFICSLTRDIYSNPTCTSLSSSALVCCQLWSLQFRSKAARQFAFPSI
jgi:hypothetical protein